MKCICLFVVVSAVLSITSNMRIKNELSKQQENNNFTSINNIPIKLSEFSIEENEGYTKYIEIKDDTKFTYFVCDDDYVSSFPTFVVYCEYVGDKKISNYDFDYKYNSDGIFVNGPNDGWCILDNRLIIFGDADSLIKFEIEIKYYEQKYLYALGVDGNSSQRQYDAISTYSIEISGGK